MKLRLLALMMSLMTLTSVGGSTPRSYYTLSATIMRLNKILEAFPDMLESDIMLDRSGEPVTPGNKWLKSSYYVDVPYYMAAYTSKEMSTIRSALWSMHSGTCVRFRELSYSQTLTTRPYLRIYPGLGCRSFIGMKWARHFQYVFLSRSGCLTRPIIQHVMMHALGFTHEHSRPDRDKYLRVYLSNINPRRRHFFNKYGSSNQVTEYDYNSILQFHNSAFSDKGYWTLRSRKSYYQSLGYVNGLSFLDKQKINKYYEC